MNDNFINKLINGKAELILPEIEDNSIDIVLTDPPYFLDKLDNNWTPETVSRTADYCNVIKSLPLLEKY
mgnify:CR=1 FL=1